MQAREAFAAAVAVLQAQDVREGALADRELYEATGIAMALVSPSWARLAAAATLGAWLPEPQQSVRCGLERAFLRPEAAAAWLLREFGHGDSSPIHVARQIASGVVAAFPIEPEE